MKRIAVAFAFVCGTVCAQAPAETPGVATIFDRQLSMIERQFVPLVEEMPADKMTFAPEPGEFKGVRTFAQQATHTAAVVYAVSAAVLGEKNPSELGQSANGPASLKTKEDIVKYVKDAFAYGHKAMAVLTEKNLTDQLPSPFGGSGKMARLAAASEATWHSFDHYGQMVIYARMNGIVPPASRPRK